MFICLAWHPSAGHLRAAFSSSALQVAGSALGLHPPPAPLTWHFQDSRLAAPGAPDTQPTPDPRAVMRG